jgi:hypothetical protein
MRRNWAFEQLTIEQCSDVRTATAVRGASAVRFARIDADR